VIYGAIFFLIARRFAKKRSDNQTEVYWLLLNWWIKSVACVLYAWMIVYYYKYGDPIGYKERSDALLHSILRNPENIKYVFAPVESFKNYLTGIGYTPYDLLYYTEANFMVSRVSCVIAFFTFNRFLIISFVFTNLAYYGFVTIYRAAKKIIKGYNKELAISCLFIPSCVYWSSGFAKEAVCMIALGIMFNCVIKIFFIKKYYLVTIVSFIFFSYVLNTVKDYIFICFAFAFVCWMFYLGIKKLLRKTILFKIGFALLFLATVFIIQRYYTSLIISVAQNYIGDIITSNIQAYESMSAQTKGGGSLIEIKDFDFSSFEGILKFIPQGLLNVFFRPFPWEILNVLMVFTVLENLFFIYLFVKVLLKSRFFTNQLFINRNYQIFAMIFSIALAFVIGISTFNFGTMVRYKIPFLPFWASFLLIINKKLSERKSVVKL
jgi:hypothetical protein